MHTPTAPSADCFSRREPLAAYLDCGEYVSSSALRRFSRRTQSPTAAMRTAEVPKEATLGDALHALLLEPDRFDEDFFTTESASPGPPPPDPEQGAGRTWLSRGARASLDAMCRAVLNCPRLPLARWMASGEKELSIYWTDTAGGRWKARPDCICDDVVVELKTTADVRPAQFLKSRKRFGYDLQAAHYVDGVTRLTGHRPRFVYVAVESVRPHAVWVHELEPDALHRAADQLAELRDRFRSALAAEVAAA